MDIKLKSNQKTIIQKTVDHLTRTRYIVLMSLTAGELLALKNALNSNPTMVGADVRDYVNNALEVAKIDL